MTSTALPSVPSLTLPGPHSPTRTRSVSQPLREGVAVEVFSAPGSSNSNPKSAQFRHYSTNTVSHSLSASSPIDLKKSGATGRARSSSLVTVTEVGGDEPENVIDRLGAGTNENAAWVNAPGTLNDY